MQSHNTTRAKPSRISLNCEQCGKHFTVQGCLIRQAIKAGQHVSMRVPLEKRFWLKVNKTARCWIWTGSLFETTGYGRISIGKKSPVAHRVAWELTFGAIPEGLMVLHDCDRFYPAGDRSYRACVRPDHLFLGTHADNMADCKSKGRQATGKRNGAYTKPETRARGERSGMSKLSDAIVSEIRRRYKTGSISQEKLGKEYGVNQTLVGFIVRGAI